jgi:glutamate synthase (NADPH/NADH) small chain
MGDPRGFMTTDRELPKRRPVDIRIRDWREVYEDFEPKDVESQAGRCMDCGIPFCHNGCPLGNLIPEWNELIYDRDWGQAIERLHATNNFPEFTGRLCPAPCESACVLGINEDPVAIKQIEVSIVDRAWQSGWIKPAPPESLSGRTVAVIGSGPAGLATAQQLARAGHTVAVYERADRIGGLLRYGIPEFKMEKHHLDQRLEQLEAEGVKFRPGVEIGVDLTGSDLRHRYDAIVVCIGATVARELEVPGRDLDGIHQAMEFLPLANRVQEGDLESSPYDVAGKHVVILGGGDTGADCLGTSLRQGAASVTQLEIMPNPGLERGENSPWPTYPTIYRVSSAHEEGGDRLFSMSTQKFLTEDGKNVSGIELAEVEFVNGNFSVVAGTQQIVKADVVLLAMGFTGPEQAPYVQQLGLELDARGNIKRDSQFATDSEGVFVAGDAGRGQSLIVWAIAEGRAAAAAVDKFLMGSTNLPSPVSALDRPLTV